MNPARITLTLGIPHRWWHFLMLPISIPLMVVFVVLTVPLFYLIACFNEWIGQ